MGGVIGPRDNVFLGPAVALDGPGLGLLYFTVSVGATDLSLDATTTARLYVKQQITLTDEQRNSVHGINTLICAALSLITVFATRITR